jgi:phosphocarrier protein
MHEISLVICNQKGLHARAAAAFVKCAGTFNAEIMVEKDGQEADGCSILSLMMLAASKGTTIKVRACGDDAAAAIEAISALVNAKFGEEQ